MDYVVIADDMLSEDPIDMYIEIQEICTELDMFTK